MRFKPPVSTYENLVSSLASRVLLVLLALVGSAPVRAQTVAPLEIPTRGLLLPGSGPAGPADATALEVNPGQLGLLPGGASALVLNHWADESPHPGRGAGLLFASPFLVRGLSLGAGLSFLMPTDPLGGEDRTKLTVGTGFRLSRGLGVGLSWDHLFGSPYRGTDSWSLGFSLRPHDRLALGGVVRDVNRPRPAADLPRLDREWAGEIAVRPFGTDLLEIAGGVLAMRVGPNQRAVGQTRRFLPQGRFSLRLWRGLYLFGQAAKSRPRPLLAAAPGAELAEDFVATLGLSASFDRLSFAAASVGGLVDGSGGLEPESRLGGSFVVRGSQNRQPALVSPRHVARVRLTNLEDDRRFLGALLGLRRLTRDPAVGAVVVVIENLGLGYGRVEELRAVLVRMGTEKPTFASLHQPSTREYHLASACDTIVLHPAGSLFLGGIAQNVVFFKNLLDALGVGVDLVRIAEYKGAMEPFVMAEQSEPVRDNREAVLSDIYARLVRGIGQGRELPGLESKAITSAIDQALFSPAEAKDLGLVDEIAEDDRLDKLIKTRLGRSWAIRDADLGRRDDRRWRPRRIAVVMVDGAITDGKPQGLPVVRGAVAWADPIVEALGAARRDSSIRAVVLRINSPGGSAFASDRIAREVARLKEAGKPVVASMADTAASGGYYIAAPADEIFASPSAITGSIGIYSFKVDVGRLFSQLGLNVETTTRGARADLFSLYSPWSEAERQAVASKMEYAYRRFLEVVADGRKDAGIDLERAHELGRGRIYTGQQAERVGLVDRLGDFGQAVHAAARRGEVPLGPDGTPEMVVLPQLPANPLETLLALRRLVSAQTPPAEPTSGGLPAGSEPGASEPGAGEADASPAWVGFFTRHGRTAARLILPLLAAPEGVVQARLPYEIEIR